MAMQREEDAPGDNGPENQGPESDDGWYFDLPGGAWERQQEKNTELRRRIIENVEGHSRDLPLDPEPPKRGLFGRSRKQQGGDPHRETPGGTYRLARGEPPEGPVEDVREQAPPEPGAPPPLRLRRHDPAGGLDPDEWSTEPPGIPEVESAGEGQPRSRWEEMFGAPTGGGGIESDRPGASPGIPTGAPGHEEPASRWDQAFGTPAEGGLLEGMRSWARGEPLDATSVEDDQFSADDQLASSPVPVEDESPKTSRWDDMFSAPADEGSMIEGMRRWASGEPAAPEVQPTEEPAPTGWNTPRSAPTFEREGGYQQGAPESIGPLPWEVDESVPAEVPPHAAAFASAWNTDEPDLPGAGDAAAPEPRKRGFLGRLFGRKKTAPEEDPGAMEPGLSTTPVGAWIMPGDDSGGDIRIRGEITHQPASGWLASDDELGDWVPPQEEPGGNLAWTPPAEPQAEPELVADWPSRAEAGEQPEAAAAWPPPAEPVAEPPEPVTTWVSPGETISETTDTTPSPFDTPAPEPEWARAESWTAPAGQADDAGAWSPEPIEAEAAETATGDDPWAGFLSSRQPQPEPGLPATPRASEPEDTGWTWEPAPAGPANEQAAPETADETANWPAASHEESGWGDVIEATGDSRQAAVPDAGGPFAGDPWREEEPNAPHTARPVERGDVARWLDSALDSGAGLEPDPVLDWQSSTPASPAPAPGGFAPQAPLTVGDWQLGDDDDVVLRAFEAHASTEIDEDADFDPFELPSERNTTFTDLLGSEGDDLVAELTEPDMEMRPFSRLQGWAPQRTIAADLATEWPGASPGGIPDIDPAAVDAADAGLSPFAFETPHEPASSARAHHSRARTVVREAVETLLLAILVFLAVRASFQNFKVDGQSMYPTLDDGQFLIVNKLVYAEVDMEKLGKFIPFIDAGNDPKRNVFHAPQRGDIVVLKDPRDPSQDLIKRIIALPGESVEIRDGKVYINDHYLEEPYIKSAWHDTKSKLVIGEDEYFVMGDNRSNSLDSRSTSIGLVHKDLIIGKAMLSYWPTSSFGLAPNEAGKLASDVSTADGRPVLTARLIED